MRLVQCEIKEILVDIVRECSSMPPASGWGSIMGIVALGDVEYHLHLDSKMTNVNNYCDGYVN